MSMIRPASPPLISLLEGIQGKAGNYERTRPEILWERSGSARISRYIKKRSSIEIYETDYSITLFNQSISELYAYAFTGAMSTALFPNRVRLEVNDDYRNMICR